MRWSFAVVIDRKVAQNHVLSHCHAVMCVQEHAENVGVEDFTQYALSHVDGPSFADMFVKVAALLNVPRVVSHAKIDVNTANAYGNVVNHAYHVKKTASGNVDMNNVQKHVESHVNEILVTGRAGNFYLADIHA